MRNELSEFQDLCSSQWINLAKQTKAKPSNEKTQQGKAMQCKCVIIASLVLTLLHVF
jgi:hypothetical protein